MKYNGLYASEGYQAWRYWQFSYKFEEWILENDTIITLEVKTGNSDTWHLPLNLILLYKFELFVQHLWNGAKPHLDFKKQTQSGLRN